MSSLPKIAPATLNQVEAHLPAFGEHGLTPAELHKRVGMWSHGTIWHAVRVLVAQGRCVFTGEPWSRRYTRAEPK